MKNILIAIDPGVYSLGYAIFFTFEDNRELFFLASGTISFSAQDTLPKKLSLLYDFFYKLVSDSYLSRDDFSVLIVCENQFIKHNQKDIFVVVACKSLFMLIAGQLNCCFLQISPCEAKRLVAGSGAADKEQVFRCLQILYPGFSPSSFDESDAAALAVAAWRKKSVSLD